MKSLLDCKYTSVLWDQSQHLFLTFLPVVLEYVHFSLFFQPQSTPYPVRNLPHQGIEGIFVLGKSKTQWRDIGKENICVTLGQQDR